MQSYYLSLVQSAVGGWLSAISPAAKGQAPQAVPQEPVKPEVQGRYFADKDVLNAVAKGWMVLGAHDGAIRYEVTQEGLDYLRLQAEKNEGLAEKRSP